MCKDDCCELFSRNEVKNRPYTAARVINWNSNLTGEGCAFLLLSWRLQCCWNDFFYTRKTSLAHPVKQNRQCPPGFSDSMNRGGLSREEMSRTPKSQIVCRQKLHPTMFLLHLTLSTKWACVVCVFISVNKLMAGCGGRVEVRTTGHVCTFWIQNLISPEEEQIIFVNKFVSSHCRKSIKKQFRIWRIVALFPVLKTLQWSKF